MSLSNWRLSSANMTNRRPVAVRKEAQSLRQSNMAPANDTNPFLSGWPVQGGAVKRLGGV